MGKIVKSLPFKLLLGVIVGILLGLGNIYFIGVGIAAGTLYYQHKIVSPTDLSRVTQRYFMRNGIVSVAIFACTWVSYFF